MDHLSTHSATPPSGHHLSLFGSYHVPDLGLRLQHTDFFNEYSVARYFITTQSSTAEETSHLPTNDTHDFAQIQAWLYFALIRDVFGSAIRFDDFLGYGDNDQRRVDSSILRQYVSRWQKEQKSCSSVAQVRRREEIVLSIKIAWKCCTILDSLEMDLPQMMIVFSVRVLVATIWDMIHLPEMVGDKLRRNDHFSADQVAWVDLPPSYKPIASMMVEYGWCSHEILKLLSTYTLVSVWCIARAHNQDSPGLQHQRCFEAMKCVARTIDPTYYQPLHLEENCNCSPIGPDISQVCSILEDGGVPLIRCSVDKRKEFTFKVIRATRFKRHIAFSHVWADGIVIPSANQVNYCQFANLFTYMQEAWPDVMIGRLSLLHPAVASYVAHQVRTRKTFYIWFDIFCIPTAQDVRSMALRKKAIGNIYRAFAGAECVLVIDRSLTRLQHDRLSTIDTMARIASSAWMSRCWTLSEASLAEKSLLLFCIGTKLVRYTDLDATPDSQVYAAHDAVSKGVFRNIYQQALLPFQIAWFASHPVISDFAAFIFIWNHLTSRSTSWPDDVWGIMATLLGYNGGEVMALPEIERLPALLKPLVGKGVVPGSFLFRDLPRYSSGTPSQRWMPRTIEKTIRVSDSILSYRNGGILLFQAIHYRFFIKLDAAPLQTFSVKFSHERLTRSYCCHITIHDYETFQNYLLFETDICLVLHIDVRDGGGLASETQGAGGIGCCLQVTQSRSNTLVEAEFLSSLSFSTIFTDRPCDYNVTQIGPAVHIKCDQENWYSLQSRRQKHKFAPWTISRVLYSIIPACYFGLYAIILTPLWIIYRKSHLSSLFLATILALLPFAVYILLVIFHEDFLFQNWIASFSPQERPLPWWKRIMPLW